LKVLLLVLLSTTLAAQFPCRAETAGVITAEDLNVRPEPGTHRPPIGRLQRGNAVRILDTVGEWLKIQHGDMVGYILDRPEFIQPVEKPLARIGDSDGAGGEIHRYREEARELNRKIEDAEALIRNFSEKESDLLDTLHDLDYEIDQAGKRVRIIRSALGRLQKNIEASQQAHKERVAQIERNQIYAAQRLVALYKLNRTGAVSILASAGSVFEVQQRKYYLQRILDHDQEIRQRLLDDQRQLKEVLEGLNEEKAEKARLEAVVGEELEKLAHSRKERAALLSRVREKKSLQMAALASMKTAAKALDRKLAALATQPEIAAPDDSLQSFSALKGLLKMPVEGRIVNFFGPQKNTRFNVTIFQSGIDIQARTGEVIQAVYAGRVLFADWFKGFGNMIIIDHGENYYTVYAHLDELYKQKGDFVATGADIATVGDTGSMTEPVLHFEVRHHGKPLDPLDWIAKG
jgi:septal ring factor EnvC (AmiA/AmiB activator)